MHSLLHVAACVEWTGPVWAYWAFPMERYCGQLQSAVTGRLNPYPGIDRHIRQLCQWEQLKLKY
ncbi:hypothetical protein CALVIDRAFT_489305, partial [Calocera viscosa TUFC12733]